MEIIKLIREKDDGKQTLGNISSDNFLCKTLERPWKENKNGISCIPKGSYLCKWTFSPKLMRKTYEVMNVKNRSGIRIHKGNYFFDIEGCILLGTGYQDLNKDGEVDIINSTITIQKFENLMNKQTFILSVQ